MVYTHSKGLAFIACLWYKSFNRKEGLSLNIDTNINSLDIDLAKSVGQYFRLNANEMNDIVNEVRKSVSKWQAVAKEIGITKTNRYDGRSI